MPDTLEDTLKEDRCPIYIKNLEDAALRLREIASHDIEPVLTCIYDLDDERSFYLAADAVNSILSETAKCKTAGFCDEGYIDEKIATLKNNLKNLKEFSGYKE